MFSTTVRDNLLYGVKHLPLRDAEYDNETRQATEKWRVEAIAAGNSTDDINADWIDYDAADAPDDHALLLRILETLTMVTLDGDIYQLGLRGSIDPATQPGLAEQFLKARAEFHTRLTDPEIAGACRRFRS
jgi:putative ABC transport system ATP-binding protein